jgi:hypothetical protein
MGNRIQVTRTPVYFCDVCKSEHGNLRKCSVCGKDLCDKHRAEIETPTDVRSTRRDSVCPEHLVAFFTSNGLEYTYYEGK